MLTNYNHVYDQHANIVYHHRHLQCNPPPLPKSVTHQPPVGCNLALVAAPDQHVNGCLSEQCHKDNHQNTRDEA